MSAGAVMDLCALILLFSLISCICYRNRLWSSSDKVFFVLLIVCTLCTAADLIDVVTNENGMAYTYAQLYASSYVYFLLRNITPFAYVCYIVSLTGRGYAIKRNPALLLFFLLPLLLSVLLIAGNPLTHLVFYYDAAHVYHRGSGMFLLYFTSGYYMLLSILYTWKYQEAISPEKRYAIYSFAPLSLGAVVVQQVFPELLVEMFMTALCIMLIMFTLQKKEEVMEGTTGLWNRATFIRDVYRSFSGENEFTDISINISNLKLLKKTIGFVQADKVLDEIAQFIKQYRPEVDGLYAARDGRFDILLYGKNRNKKEKIAESLNREFKKPWMHDGLGLSLIVYIAISECPADFRDKDDLLRFTDGFHKYVPFSGEILYASDLKEKKPLYRDELEKIIEQAWQENRFEVYYQPIYSTKTGSFRSAEALLRLHHEQYGFIPPDEFIPVAEANTSILKIGQFVLESVCKFIAENNLEEMGIEYIEVNLSTVQCIQSDMAEKIVETVGKYGIRPSQINLEITETATIYSPEIMRRNMELLKENGILFSLDDYGSGYSNINYLLNFPFSLIKLDKGIVCGKKENRKNWIAMKYSIEMLKEMGYLIVAEGVETRDMVEDLEEQGCQYLQGYYFSRPVPGESFLKFIREHADVKKRESPLAH